MVTVLATNLSELLYMSDGSNLHGSLSMVLWNAASLGEKHEGMLTQASPHSTPSGR